MNDKWVMDRWLTRVVNKFNQLIKLNELIRFTKASDKEWQGELKLIFIIWQYSFQSFNLMVWDFFPSNLFRVYFKNKIPVKKNWIPFFKKQNNEIVVYTSSAPSISQNNRKLGGGASTRNISYKHLTYILEAQYSLLNTGKITALCFLSPFLE